VLNSKNIQSWQKQVNSFGASNTPFLFIIDYAMENPQCIELSDLPKSIHYAFHEHKNIVDRVSVKPFPKDFQEYNKGFEKLQNYLHHGDSYLVNYTVETPIEIDYTLREIFDKSVAPYKLLVDDSFVVFSPETFITIDDIGTIATFPMKGTIDAEVPNAKSEILTNKKEMAEHATVVDLLRNDLSKVATNVQVEEYRYIQEVNTSKGKLLQVCSKITGQLSENWKCNIADILLEMLPAGSVTGAPKKKTLEIISDIETHQRGYYTGIFGIFDGQKLDSGVMIRFIEQRDGKFYYKSGGGVTTQSIAEDEYKELIQKIYVPIG
jgi:para-aminobenzoate synthetase component I